MLDAVRERAVEEGRGEEELIEEAVGRYLSAPREEREKKGVPGLGTHYTAASPNTRRG